MVIDMIVSGGQTGVDRAALDVAIELAVPHGGWCPLGRRSEDGPIEPIYQLRETESAKYPARTRRNVEDSDGTLILYLEELTGGSELTERLALRCERPCLAVDLRGTETSTEVESSSSHPGRGVQAVLEWLSRHHVRKLNVAGPRLSSSPGIDQLARQFLRRVIMNTSSGA